ncbi:Hypothetical protein NGAL_HAMBI2605_62630 [Neorhizobium galegae bv. orientalis]|nr:Hypothetical protein NGAL_HAMBI2605_62630 [Neorhizobium galegae bv. orientalis]
MAASHHSSEGRSRSGRMLRTALGSAICRFLEDTAIVELMLNRSGRIWIDRLSEGLPGTGKRLSPGDGERIVRLAAHHVGAQVHASAPRMSAELPETVERVQGLCRPWSRPRRSPSASLPPWYSPSTTMSATVPYRGAKPRHFGWTSPPALTSSWLAGLRPSQGHGAQQGRQLPAHRVVSRSRYGLCRAGRTGCRRWLSQQRVPPPGLRLGNLRGSATPCRLHVSRQYVLGLCVGAGQCRASGRIRESGEHFESSYFLTFCYLPSAEGAGAEAWHYEGREKTGIDPHEMMSGVADCTDRLIEAFMPECRWLYDGDALAYLHRCVTASVSPKLRPSRRTACRSAADWRVEPRLGSSHLRVLSFTRSIQQ